MRKGHPLSPSLFEEPYFFLLESSLADSERGRYTIAAADPLIVLEAKEGEDFFETLRGYLEQSPVIEAPDLPFAGGWIGYLGYELHSDLEKRVPARAPDLIPKAVFCFYDSFYLYDHLQKKASWVSAQIADRRGGTRCLPLLCKEGQGEVDHEDRGCCPRDLPLLTSPYKGEENIKILRSNFTKAEYLTAIRRIKDYIAAGDCYQVNLSQRFTRPVLQSPYEIYRRLCAASPAPYAAFLNLGDAQILSSSPECFLRVEDRQVVTRPIKGTRPRGRTEEEDKRLRKELEESVKDHAELLMITDLERNDLGRVCRAGSVEVPELCRIETFAQVHHLVATVRGELRAGVDVVDLLKATFPGGSITGAPKIRAMQIIRELEPVPRNVYCGAIGYLSLNGKAQFNIAIRTMILKNKRAHFWAGGGIVADSDPEREYEEVLVKAAGMEAALDSLSATSPRQGGEMFETPKSDRKLVGGPAALNEDGGGRLDHRRCKGPREEEPHKQTDHQEHIVDPDGVEIGEEENHSQEEEGEAGRPMGLKEASFQLLHPLSESGLSPHHLAGSKDKAKADPHGNETQSQEKHVDHTPS